MTTKIAPISKDSAGKMRRRPQQARGQQRVEAILAAAEVELAEVGYEAATTNQIAVRAGIPIGSLYQFFPNKQAIMQELARRHHEALAAGIRASLEQSQRYNIAQVVDTLTNLAPIMSQGRSRFVRMCLEALPGTPMYEASAAIRGEVFQAIVALIRVFAPTMSEAECQLHARISQAAWQALLPLYVFELDEGRPELAERILAQSKVLQTAYFERVLQNWQTEQG